MDLGKGFQKLDTPHRAEQGPGVNPHEKNDTCNRHANTPAAHCCKRHALRYTDDVDEFDLVTLPEVCARSADRRRTPQPGGRGIVIACCLGLLAWLVGIAWLASRFGQ
jgi:hypothetical protein